MLRLAAACAGCTRCPARAADRADASAGLERQADGAAVTAAQTGPARTVTVRACQLPAGIQNHSGKPTSPS